MSRGNDRDGCLIFLLAAAFATIVAASSCDSQGASQDKEVKELREQIDRLEKILDSTRIINQEK